MEEQDEDLWSSSLDDRNSEGMFVEGGVIATLYSEILAFAIERKLPSQMEKPLVHRPALILIFHLNTGQ